LRSLAPASKHGLEIFKTTMLPVWRHTLLLDLPRKSDSGPQSKRPFAGRTAVIFAYRQDEHAAEMKSLAEKLISQLPANCTGHADSPHAAAAHDQFTNFYTTYNRTALQKEVEELINMCVMSRVRSFDHVILCGLGRVGPAAILAAPAADAVIADCDQLEVNSERLLAHDLFCPGFQKMGGFETAAVLAAPHPLLLYNVGTNFPTARITTAYNATSASDKLRIDSTRLPEEELVRWIKHLQ